MDTSTIYMDVATVLLVCNLSNRHVATISYRRGVERDMVKYRPDLAGLREVVSMSGRGGKRGRFNFPGELPAM